MWVRFTNRDSTDSCPTRRLTVTVDGERHLVDVHDNGAANVPEAVGEHLVASDAAVEQHDDAEDDEPAIIPDADLPAADN